MFAFSVLVLLVAGLFSEVCAADEIKTEKNSLPLVHVAVVEGMIGPVSEEFLKEAFVRADAAGVDLLVIQLDTPGGLLESTRHIVKELLGSKIPVAVYVAPSGSRAGSAGVFITLAGHIAAMAPGTNIGAAHPVSIGPGGGGGTDSTSVMGEKIINDTSAFIKTIAAQRNRNVAWADSAVRYSVSITETEALERGVIDLVAPDVEALVDSLDGYRVALSASDTLELKLAGAVIETHEYNWRNRLLSLLGDPNIAFVLFLVGLAGLYFELSNPGLILPGIVGAISLVLAFFSFQTLPINYAGLLLIILGIIFFIIEIKVPSFGLLTLGGVISMVLGAIMLYRGTPDSPTMPEVKVDWSVLIPSVLAIVLFFVFVVGKAVQAMRSKVSTGDEGLIGNIGVARTSLEPKGKVFVHGEIWDAVSRGGEVINANSDIRVLEVKNLRLVVEEYKGQ